MQWFECALLPWCQDEKRMQFSEQAVARCLAPGASKYEVMQLEPGASAAEIKKAYKTLSLLVHPVPNPRHP